MVDRILKYEEIEISYNEKTVISNFDLDINKGEKILLKGRSGSGKSTLLKIPLGFAHPTSGAVYFKNKLMDSKTVWDMRERFAYICQDVDICEGTVKGHIDEIFSYRTNTEELDKEKLKSLLDHFELEENILHKNFEDLSGGEKQRISIITTLLLNRQNYLLDEITSSLDARLKIKVADYFLDHEDWTLLIVSHDREWERDGVKIINVGD